MKTETRLLKLISRGAAGAVGAVTAITLCYAIAGLIGGMIPSNRGWRVPATGLHVFVESNGVHTEIIVPKVAVGVDWRGVTRPGDLREPRFLGYDHVAFGWGRQHSIWRRRPGRT